MSETTGAGWKPPPDGPHIEAMSAALARNWWAIALRGVFAILFAIIALLLPGVTIASLVLLYGAYMLVDGVCAIVSAIRAAAHYERWGLLILEGIVDILAALVAFALPGITVLVFVTLLGAWSIVSGVMMTVAAFRLWETHGGWLLALSGVISVVWGLLLFISPIAGAVVLTWWLGAYAFAFGIALLFLAFRLRTRHEAASATAGAAPG